MKKTKRKFLAVLLGITLTAVLAGCGKKNPSANEGEEPVAGGDIIPVKDMGQVELGEYKGIEVTVQDTTVTDEEVEYYISQFIDENTTQEEITDREDVQSGDVANINYSGTIDGVAFDGGTDASEEGFDLTIGSDRFIPGFEEKLIGFKIGETKDITVTFPEDYAEEGSENEHLNGKEAVFTVTINKLSRRIVPELTDEFVAENAETGSTTVDELREYYMTSLKSQKEANAESQWQNDAIRAVIEKSTFSDLNDKAIAQDRAQVSQYYDNMANSLYGVDGLTMVSVLYGLSEEDYNKELDNMALFTVQEKVLALEIAKMESLQIEEEDYQESLGRYYEEVSGQFDSKEAFEQEFGRVLIEENILVERGIQVIFDNVVKK